MDEALQVVIEMNDWAWNRFKDDLKDLTQEELNWRPVPEANTINLIVRHLRIEADWHLASIGNGPPSARQPTDSVPLDFEQNLRELETLFTRFIAALRGRTLAELEQQGVQAYQESAPGRTPPPHFLAFHQVVHLAMHWGQIRTIRNLYRKTRGEPARFFPDNPTFPT
jgi:uncharacterized damage-inducible protein DinB